MLFSNKEDILKSELISNVFKSIGRIEKEIELIQKETSCLDSSLQNITDILYTIKFNTDWRKDEPAMESLIGKIDIMNTAINGLTNELRSVTEVLEEHLPGELDKARKKP